jgi:uncharacterized protein YdcH (DUF465 family)
MEQRDLELITKFGEQDAEVKALWQEHLEFERLLQKLESKPFLTPADEQEVRDLKKRKLAGKTKLEGLLNKYRTEEA